MNCFLCDVVKRSPLVQYRAQLFLYGFWDDFDARDAINISARQSQLRAHRSRWSRLEWAARTTVKFPGTPSGVTGGVFHTISNYRTLHFVRLPSISRGVTQNEWTLPDLGFEIKQYFIDPGADLLIALEHQQLGNSWWVVSKLGGHKPPDWTFFNSAQLHILLASTGDRHLLASVPVISYPTESTCICEPFIFGSQVYLGFVPEDIICWDWQTGELVFVRLATTPLSVTSSPNRIFRNTKGNTTKSNPFLLRTGYYSLVATLIRSTRLRL